MYHLNLYKSHNYWIKSLTRCLVRVCKRRLSGWMSVTIRFPEVPVCFWRKSLKLEIISSGTCSVTPIRQIVFFVRNFLSLLKFTRLHQTEASSFKTSLVVFFVQILNWFWIFFPFLQSGKKQAMKRLHSIAVSHFYTQHYLDLVKHRRLEICESLFHMHFSSPFSTLILTSVSLAWQ